MKQKLLLAIFLLVASLATSQTSNITFSENHEEFIPQLEKLFALSSDKKKADQFIEDYTIFWESGKISEKQKKQIIAGSNKLSLRKARAIPDYQVFLDAIRAYVEIPTSSRNYDAWMQWVVSMMNNRKVHLRTLTHTLKLSTELANNNVIYSTSLNYWKSNNNNWTLKFENEQLTATFPDLTLQCFSKRDSIEIYNTKGEFNYSTLTWKGEKGKIDWTRSGFDANQVFATFGAYSIPFKHSYFDIDTVEFINKEYMEQPMKGHLSHKLMEIKTPANAKYPKFTSFESRYKLDKIFTDINYEGGFSQHGAQFLGSGTPSSPAQITIFRNNEPFLVAKAPFFSLRKDQILGSETEVRFAIEDEQIFHPGLLFKYMVNSNEVQLIRNGEGVSRSPYFNTYHNVSMDIEMLSWKLGSQTIDMKMMAGAAENVGEFESLSFFRESFYNHLQGMDAIHPLQALKNCAIMYGEMFTASDFARSRLMPENQIRQQVLQLSFHGFIKYNAATDSIQVNDRLYDYLDFRLGKLDYDVIAFASRTPGKTPNAQLNLSDYSINVNGVKSISISDNKNVTFFPQDQQFVLNKNRNFVFNGVITAGMLTLFGNGFKFNYEDFLIDMEKIDSMRMMVKMEELNYLGHNKNSYVKSMVESLSGTLKIDEPNNKSGKEKNEQFPILNSTQESYVYYDRKDIQGGKYDREKFYFKLDTFSFYGINTLTQENINFTGTFVSNIFPEFKEELIMRNDYSLGFEHEANEEGYDVYENKAHLKASLDLSNRGLLAGGTLEYLTTTTTSDSLILLPDQAKGLAYKFEIKDTLSPVEYPDVAGNTSYVDFLPSEDKLTAKTLEETFEMYKTEAQLDGEITVTPQGSTGKGSLLMSTAQVSSNYLDFSMRAFAADSADFKMLSTSEDEGMSFDTKNLVAYVDFDKREGKFVSKDHNEPVRFTDNRYISFIKNFTWNMDDSDLLLGGEGSSGNRFVSTHRRQDSLEFTAPWAKYDTKAKIIYAKKVEYIEVADALIQLNNGEVTIRKNAEMDALDSARVILGVDTTYEHSIYNSKIKINGKYDYEGSGQYDFFTSSGQRQIIEISKVGVNDDKITVAEGAIPQDANFRLNNNFTFKGNIDLISTQKDLNFDGGAKMIHKCKTSTNNYVYFEAPINPDSVLIPIGKEPVNFERNKIYRDFFLTVDSTHAYSSFLSTRKDYSDIPVITAGEYLYYNNNDSTFTISDLQNINNPEAEGTVFKFSSQNCNVEAEGKMNLGIEVPQIDIVSSGKIVDNPNKDKISFNGIFGVDLKLNDLIVEQMLRIITTSKVAQGSNNDSIFTKHLAELIGKKRATDIVEDSKTDDKIRRSNIATDKTLLFESINMEFDDASHSYIANCKADLGFIASNVVNKSVDVKMEIAKKRTGNTFEMFMSFDESTWLYFGYRNKIMYTVSSDSTYNRTIVNLTLENEKDNNKKSKREDEEKVSESDSKIAVAETSNTESVSLNIADAEQAAKEKEKQEKKAAKEKAKQEKAKQEKAKAKQIANEEKALEKEQLETEKLEEDLKDMFELILSPSTRLNVFIGKFGLEPIKLGSAAGQKITTKVSDDTEQPNEPLAEDETVTDETENTQE